MTISAPSGLGYAECDGYKPHLNPVFKGTVVASGGARYRRDRSLNVNQVDIRFIWNAQQFRRFELFYFKTLQSGLLWFYLPLRTSTGVQMFESHIVGGYSPRFLGGRDLPHLMYWEVSMNIEFIYNSFNAPFVPVDAIQARINAIDFIENNGEDVDIISGGIVGGNIVIPPPPPDPGDNP
jgi:hypothetical protein